MKYSRRFKAAPASARASAGFTLIELMITVAIIGILAAVAYPSYTSYIRKGKRATAQSALMDLASKEQTYLLDRRLYYGATGSTAESALATNLSFAKPGEIANDYTFSVTCTPSDCSTPTGFTATATPSSALQAKGEQVLTVDNTGAKTPANTSGYWGR